MYAVILAGGGGTRLWPLARAGRPKQFLALTGGDTLFQQACGRGAAVATRARVLVVCGREHLHWVRRQAPWIPARRIITEGAGRNTAASIALAAHWIRRRAGDGTMVVIPSDHRIAPLGAFRRDVRRATREAQRHACLVIFGVTPTAPDTGLGYIRMATTPARGRSARVRGFIEKPDRARARRLLADGGALWNCGVFVWRASTILSAFEAHAGRLARAVRRCIPAPRAIRWRIPAGRMARVPDRSVDRAVLEKADHIVVVRATFDWSDLGTFDALAVLLARETHAHRWRGGFLGFESRDCVSINPEGLTVLMGTRDLIVVRDGGVVVVCPRGGSQDVREVQRRLVGRLAAFA